MRLVFVFFSELYLEYDLLNTEQETGIFLEDQKKRHMEDIIDLKDGKSSK